MQTFLLYTNDIENAMLEIETHGGKINQQLSSQLMSAQLPDEFDVSQLKSATSTIPEDIAPDSQLALEGWKRNMQKSAALESSTDRQGLPWDAEGFLSPSLIISPDQPLIENATISRSTGTPTSLYMIGSVAVGIVIVSGKGNYKISQSETAQIIGEVQEGLEFLASAEPRAKVSFVHDIHVIDVAVTPGSTHDYEPAESPWRNEALRKMGYAKSRQGSIEYVNDLRSKKGTDWAYVAYFTKYPLHHFAYAVEEKLVMSYYNDGWGADYINAVFAHETCHLFGADDEYGNCDCKSINGYLRIPNKNCKNCSGQQLPCLMNENTLVMCEWTRKQIGWDEELFPRENV